jgi:hypothetical protein
MGGTASSLMSGIPSSMTGNEFSEHAKTKEIKAMSDALFQYMYSTWDLRDIFDIVKHPGEYVVAISDLITSEFHVLGYTTKKNKIGEIYFRKFEQLDPPQTAENFRSLNESRNTTKSLRRKKKEEALRKKGITLTQGEPGSAIHKQHTQIIAFYFVRIFQILGSLLLVVKDSEFPLYDENTGREKYSKYAVSNREYASQGLTLPRFRPIQGGGETYFSSRVPLGLFEFLRYYLRDYDRDTVEKYRKIVSNFPEESKRSGVYKVSQTDSLFFKPPEPGPGGSPIDPRSQYAKGSFYIIVRRKDDNRYELKEVKVSVSQIVSGMPATFDPPASIPGNQQFNKYPTQITIQTKGNDAARHVIMDAVFYKTDTRRNDIDVVDRKDYTKGVKYTLLPSMLYTAIIGTYDPESDIEKALEKYAITSAINIYQTMYVKYEEDSIEEKERKEKLRYGNTSKVSAPDNPGLTETFRLLHSRSNDIATGTPGSIRPDIKNIPHCISRALDLLDAASISNINQKDGSGNVIMTGKTRICAPDVNKLKGKLKSVGQLYGKLKPSDAINVNEEEFKNATKVLAAFIGKESRGLSTNQLGEYGQKTEQADLSSAIQRLSKAFNSLQSENITKIEDMQIVKPQRCSTASKEPDGSILIDKNRAIFPRIQGYSQKLLAYHLNKIINISKFLSSIFNISQRPDGSWNVEGPKTEILFAGFTVLDQLTDNARALLVEYYSGCEEIYQSAVKEWNDDVDAPALSRPVAGPGSPGSPGPAASRAPVVRPPEARPPEANRYARHPPGYAGHPAHYNNEFNDPRYGPSAGELR